MTSWHLAALLLLLGTIPCLIVLARGEVMERLVALQAAQLVVVLALLLLPQAYGREIYLDLSLCLAILNLGAGLVFVRFLERWL